MRLIAIILILVLFSCSKKNQTQLGIKPQKKLERVSLVFQHNNHGKIKSCGCQKKPLGGILAVSGFLNHLKKQGPVFYLSSGSRYYPFSLIRSFEESTSYNAQTLALVDKLLPLDAIVLSPNDFLMGEKQTMSLLKTSATSQLEEKIIHLKKRVLHLISIKEDNRQEKERILKQRSETKPKTTTLILVSQLGMFEDQALARKYPKIDWIIGSQDEAFTQKPQMVGKTKIVQTTSRPHHLGVIHFEHKEENDKFSLIPTHEKWEQNASPDIKKIIKLYEVEKAKIDKREKEALEAS